MKFLNKVLLAVALFLGVSPVLLAQTKAEKKALLADVVRKVVASDDYFFSPRYANSSGGSFDVSTSYSLKISKDSIAVYLPYYGNAQTSGNDPGDGTINFVWTNFSYVVNTDKKGNYDIQIFPAKSSLGKMKDAKSLTLNISLDGSASLTVISSNRYPISFDGSIGNQY